MSTNPKIGTAASAEELVEARNTLDVDLSDGLVLNRVTDLSGRLTVDGTSTGLSSQADQSLMMAIRATGDAVLIGGNTLRSEGYRPDSPGLANTNLVVVTRGSDIGSAGNHKNVTVLSGGAEPEDFAGQWIQRNGWSPGEIKNQLKDMGFNRTICEAGPTLTSKFFEADSFEELYLTISPQYGSNTSIASPSSAEYNYRYELAYAITGPESYIFTKWRKS